MDNLTKTNKLLLDGLKLANEDKTNEALKNIQCLFQKNDLNEKDYELIAAILMMSGDFDQAAFMFSKAANYTSMAFLNIIKGDINKAKEFLNKSPGSSLFYWCRFLIDLFTDKLFLRRSPSLLQIRHYLEITIYYLLIANNKLFIDILKSETKNLIKLNIDTEKFIGYAYFHFGDLDTAVKYLNQAIQRNQYDGETYYVLANVYVKKKEYYLAAAMLENAGLLLPEHNPTKLLKEKVAKKLKTMSLT